MIKTSSQNAAKDACRTAELVKLSRSADYLCLDGTFLLSLEATQTENPLHFSWISKYLGSGVRLLTC